MTSGMPTPLLERTPTPRFGRWFWIAGIAALITIGAGVAWWTSTPTASSESVRGDPSRGNTSLPAIGDTLARAPIGTRIVVRVVNASGRRGLARRATLWLRELGYDVVDFDGASGAPRERTTIADHTGHPAWGARLTRALGTGTVSADTDRSRYVDFTVFLGRDWQPPTQPLRP
jgi:hypothetical protein